MDVPALWARLEGDRDLLAELFELFAEDGWALVGDLEEGIAGSDTGAVQRAAHTIKGAVANFCAPPAVAAAFALEVAGRSGNLQDAPALLERLKVEIHAMLGALAEELAGSSGS